VAVRCPHHPDGRVWRDGYYGREVPGQFRRQRYKCVPPMGKRHVFTEALPRRVAKAHECEVCERPAPAHEGPRTPRRYQFTLWEVAHALTLVGAGASYRSASEAMRREINRPARRPKDGRRFSTQPHLLEDWVEVFGPVVDAAFTELTWPEVIAVDEVPFHVKPSRAHHVTDGDDVPFGVEAGRARARLHFSVLGALGYPKGRVCLLRAASDRSAIGWTAFFLSRAGRPSRVVCDGSPAIRVAIESAWPPPSTPLIWTCHHHLVRQILEKLPRGAPLSDLAGPALQGLSRWHEFVALARDYPAPHLHHWIETHQDLVLRQLSSPLHPLTTGGLEEKLNTLRGWLADRRGTFSNQQRTDRLLMLMRLQLNGHANRRTYHRLLQEHARSGGGNPLLKPRQIRDSILFPTL
jgi:hypothetical protein